MISALKSLALTIALLAAMFALAGIARAADSDECEKADSELSISACTRVIDSGKEKGSNLARFYYNRGTGYSNLGKHREAVEDFNRAIELRKEYPYAIYNSGIS